MPLLLLLLLVSPELIAQQARILFIRGGAGTGGFLEGGADEQLSDVFDHSTAPANHGWGELRLALEAEGHVVDQAIEGPLSDNTPVDLAALPLAAYDVVVFGSNNAEYSEQAAVLLADWVCGGGAALFISDANWGTNWGDAPTSDQVFLDHFDLVMNQDKGTYVLEDAAGDFLQPTHPILQGPDGEPGGADQVSAFDGEGVSPLSVSHLLPGVDPTVVVRAEGQMKLNNATGSGSTVFTGPDDGSLVTLSYGMGRVAGHFDRNTFFNQNGAGTSLHRFDNTRYALNLFAWLAAAGGQYGSGCPDVNGIAPQLSVAGFPSPGGQLRIKISNAPGGMPVVLLVGLGQAQGLTAGMCPLLVWPVVDPPIILELGGSGPGHGTLVQPVALPILTPLQLYTLQAFIPNAGPNGAAASTNAVAISVH